nr:MAG TPA: hypothetical protein [Caudoviricetes sp.]
MIKTKNWSVKPSCIIRHMISIWCKLKLTVMFGVYHPSELLNNGVKHMKLLTAIIGAILAVAIVVLGIIAKLSWLAVAIAFVLALIGIAGVTMAIAWTVLWFALKITLAFIICLLVVGLMGMGED